LAHICRGFDADDLVGLELENCAFPSRPVGVSFRKLSQLTVDVVLSTLAKVLQSIAAFCTNDRLSVRVDAIRPPTGHGFSAVYGRCVTFNEFSLSKNSIFVIQNDDSSCLAAALVVAVEYQKCGLVGSVVKRKFSGVRGRELWSQGARAFDSNGHGGRYEHVELFQNYFTEYTIVVYSSRSGTTRYFTGDMASSRPRLNLIMENFHYNVIFSLTGAFSVSYFCEWCSQRYSGKRRHKNCPYICPCCHDNPPVTLTTNQLRATHVKEFSEAKFASTNTKRQNFATN
jgi:hypothetical protein